MCFISCFQADTLDVTESNLLGQWEAVSVKGRMITNSGDEIFIDDKIKHTKIVIFNKSNIGFLETDDDLNEFTWIVDGNRINFYSKHNTNVYTVVHWLKEREMELFHMEEDGTGTRKEIHVRYRKVIE